jgi:hypothetical protein
MYSTNARGGLGKRSNDLSTFQIFYFIEAFIEAKTGSLKNNRQDIQL